MYLVILLYALFASVFTIAKTALDYSQPFFLIGTRMMFAGILLIGYQFFRYKRFTPFTKQIGIRLIQLAFFNIYLTNAFEFWGLKYLTSFKTCFIYSLSPFASALLSYFIFAEKLSMKKWGGLLIGFSGFLPILMSHSVDEQATGQIFFFSWAELSVVAAALSSVYGWILLRQLINEDGLSPIQANGLSMFMGGTCALIHSFFAETWSPLPVTDFTIYIECTILLIIVSNLICYNLYGSLLKKYSATFISFAGFTTPLFTALFGWLFLSEIVTWPFYISFAIVLIGLMLFDQEELKQTYQEGLQAQA
jgi:drug/metabolite transporter (DMT)-like permease